MYLYIFVVVSVLIPYNDNTIKSRMFDRVTWNAQGL